MSINPDVRLSGTMAAPLLADNKSDGSNNKTLDVKVNVAAQPTIVQSVPAPNSDRSEEQILVVYRPPAPRDPHSYTLNPSSSLASAPESLCDRLSCKCAMVGAMILGAALFYYFVLPRMR